jgi:hypothetical protein
MTVTMKQTAIVMDMMTVTSEVLGEMVLNDLRLGSRDGSAAMDIDCRSMIM